MTIISQGVLGGKTEKEAWADLLVLKDGPIKEPKDLEGKTIAVNTLNNVCEVTIKASLEKKGVDVSKLKFSEVPFPDMNAALEAKRVDGACAVEPFVSQGKAGKAKGIDPFYVNTAPDLTVATYFTSKQYAEQNPDVIKRFVKAMNKSLEYAQSHPDEVRQVLTEYTEIPPDAAQEDQAADLAVGPQPAHDRAGGQAHPEVRADRPAAGPERAHPHQLVAAAPTAPLAAAAGRRPRAPDWALPWLAVAAVLAPVRGPAPDRDPAPRPLPARVGDAWPSWAAS